MTSTEKRHWNRIALEAAAIVASILLAFAIDAWWDDRNSIEGEQVLLQSLIDDLKTKKETLDRDRNFNEAIALAVTGLIKAANDIESTVTEDAIDRMIGETWWYNVEGDWESAPMTSLVDGNLAAISNPDLGQKLAEIQVHFTRIRSFLRNDERFHHDIYTPYLVANAYMPQIAGKSEHHPGSPELAYEFPRFELAAKQNHSELIRQREFQNMMIAKLDRVQDILQNAYRHIDAVLDETIELLEQELAE